MSASERAWFDFNQMQDRIELAQQVQSGMAATMYSDWNLGMNINDLSNSKYLKTKDVPVPVLVTIASITIKNVAMDNQPKEDKPVLQFQELDKPMVMNQTNLKRAAKALNSEETEDWIGQQIVLYTDEEVEFGGEIVGGLRLRAMKRKLEPVRQAPPKPAGGFDDMDDDIPF